MIDKILNKWEPILQNVGIDPNLQSTIAEYLESQIHLIDTRYSTLPLLSFSRLIIQPDQLIFIKKAELIRYNNLNIIFNEKVLKEVTISIKVQVEWELLNIHPEALDQIFINHIVNEIDKILKSGKKLIFSDNFVQITDDHQLIITHYINQNENSTLDTY